jgi:hypothetical protein
MWMFFIMVTTTANWILSWAMIFHSNSPDEIQHLQSTILSIKFRFQSIFDDKDYWFTYSQCNWLTDWSIDWLITCSGPNSPDAPRPLLEGPLCLITIYGSLVTLPKFQMAPKTYSLYILWLQKEGAQIRTPKRSQGFTPTKDMGRGFILCSTLPTQWGVYQPH